MASTTRQGTIDTERHEPYRHPSGDHTRVIMVGNPKGGNCKTTTVVNLAAVAADRGHRVLVVDGDDQGSTTVWLGHSPQTTALLRVLTEDNPPPLDAIVVDTAIPGVELVPASTELADADKQIGGIPGIHTALRDALAGARPRDVVLIDTPGDVQLLPIMALAAAGELLLTLQLEAMVLEELPKMEQLLALVRRRLNPALRLTGILACKVPLYGRQLTIEGRQVLDQLRCRFGDLVLTPLVQQSPRHGEAYSAGQPITSYDPGGIGDQQYRAVAQALDLLPAREVVGV